MYKEILYANLALAFAFETALIACLGFIVSGILIFDVKAVVFGCRKCIERL